MSTQETVVVQVYVGGDWVDFARCTLAEAQDGIRTKRFKGKTLRGVDWISGKVVVDEQGSEVT